MLLTATPHAGDDEAFAALCRIGELRDHITMFRRSRADAGFASTRRVHLFRVACTSDERRMHRLLERYTRAVWSNASAPSDARLAMIVLRKRALSSASSLARSVARRLDALFDLPAPATQLPLPFAGAAEPDDQTPEDDEPVGALAAPGMDGGVEREWLMRLIEAATRAMNHESKIAWLSRFLTRARQPAIVFTEYRDTARWLAAALETVGPVVLLHGGLSRGERLDADRAFRTGAADILVATDAAGEGLNLQHRCRLVVNLELPWNPMRLEQRIGRVDRIGQQRRPHAIHLVAAATAEEHIVRRLVLRQERARRAVGSVADAIGTARDARWPPSPTANEPQRVSHASGVGNLGPHERACRGVRRGEAPSEEDVALAVITGSHDHVVRSPKSDVRSPRIRTPDGAPTLQAVFSNLDLGEIARDEVRRLTMVRTVACRTPGRMTKVESAAWLSTLPRARARRGLLAPGLVCLFEVRLTCAGEDVVHQSLVALHASLARPPADLDRPALWALASSDLLRDRALAAAAGQLDAAHSDHERALRVARQREEALVAAGARRDAILQPGMFDHRALRDAELRLASRTARAAEQADEITRLDRLASAPPVGQTRLALVLVIER